MKYVGFDCDECLAQVTQIMPFTLQNAAAFVFDIFANKLTSFPFIRPTFWQLLERINEEKKRGKVTVFIYSNNGSLPTLNFIGSLVDKKLNTVDFFDSIAHYDNDLRTDNTNGQYVKKWDSVKGFIDKSFKTDVGPEDVMFFDDLPHLPLSSKLNSNYVRVAPYEYPESKIDNNTLLDLWEQSDGNPSVIDVENVEETGTLPPNEEQEFLEKFTTFMQKANHKGGKKRRRKTRRKTRRKYRDRK